METIEQERLHTTARGRRMQAEAKARGAGIPIRTLNAVEVLTMRIAGHKEILNEDGEVETIVSIGTMELRGKGFVIAAETEVEVDEGLDVAKEIEQGIRPAINALLRSLKEQHKAMLAAREKERQGLSSAPVGPENAPKRKDIRECRNEEHLDTHRDTQGHDSSPIMVS